LITLRLWSLARLGIPSTERHECMRARKTRFHKNLEEFICKISVPVSHLPFEFLCIICHCCEHGGAAKVDENCNTAASVLFLEIAFFFHLNNTGYHI
jgi:hypothetical protein